MFIIVCFFIVSLYFLFFLFLGLGISILKEVKEYFSDMERYKILFKYIGVEDDVVINLVSFVDFLF